MNWPHIEALTLAEQAQVIHQQLKTLEADYLSKSLMLKSVEGANDGEVESYARKLEQEVATIARALEVHREALAELGHRNESEGDRG